LLILKLFPSHHIAKVQSGFVFLGLSWESQNNFPTKVQANTTSVGRNLRPTDVNIKSNKTPMQGVSYILAANNKAISIEIGMKTNSRKDNRVII